MRGFIALLVVATVGLGAEVDTFASCGCDKPPPPRAAIRPFAANPNQTVTLFDERLVPRRRYTVLFEARDGRSDWSRGKAVVKRDFADGKMRHQLRVGVGDVGMGPCAISVFDADHHLVYSLPDDQLTVTAAPIALHDVNETITRDGYQAAVGADGTIYIPIDTTDVSDPTTLTGFAEGFPLQFEAQNVAVFNAQGFLMTLLDPRQPGLFRIAAADSATSASLSYWRHEFHTYKREHRQRDARRTSDGEWHADGSPHVDNYHMLISISGMLPDGRRPSPGSTSPFRLVIASAPSAASPLR